MKKLIILLILVSATVSSQESKDDYILGSENITGLTTKDGLTFNYDCTVKYKFVLFGGVKMNVNITNMSITPNTYDGEEITHSLLDSLNIKHNYGSIDVKRGLYDLKTHIKFFIPFTFKDAHIINVKIPSIGWGSIDEYTYLEDKEVSYVRKKLNVIKPEDFYNLDVNLWNTEITNFNIDFLRDIKNALDEKKNKEELITKKKKELRALKANKYLSKDKLKYKKQLSEELIKLGEEICLNNQECKKVIEEVEEELINRRFKKSNKKSIQKLDDFLSEDDLIDNKSFEIKYKNGLEGVTNNQGKVLIPFRKWQIQKFEDGIAKVLEDVQSLKIEEKFNKRLTIKSKVTKTGFVDNTGTYIDKPIYNIECYCSAPFNNYLTVIKKGQTREELNRLKKLRKRREREESIECEKTALSIKRKLKNKYIKR